MNTNKKMSPHAAVAAACRQYLTKRGIKCRATSKSFAGGNSVDVVVYDQPPEIMKQLEAEFAQYEMGHFNGMEDIYEYSNVNGDVPQVKYLFVSNDHSQELKQAAWTWLRAKYANGKDLPELYSEAHRCKWYSEGYETVSEEVYKLLRGGGFGLDGKNSAEFWADYTKPVVVDFATASAHFTHETGNNVTVREGTRPRFVEIVFESKPDQETIDSLKAAGFRWSSFNRCWYGLRDSLPAEYLEGDSDPTDPSPTAPTTPTRQPVKAQNGDRFRAIALAMKGAIDAKLANRETNTPKRLKQANQARREGEHLQRVQKALFALADAHEAGTVPPVLAGVKTKAQVSDLLTTKSRLIENGYHCYYVCSGEPLHTSPEAVALWSLIGNKSETDKKADELRRAVESLKFLNIPGYFPTPDKVIELMLEIARIESGHKVLEPSAGHGAIADAVKSRHGAAVKCCERNYTLRGILTMKGYDLAADDFMEYEATGQFDRVVMNPPFENLQDIDHVMHAFNHLAPGGVLVSVMSPGPFFRSDKKSAHFREWFAGHGGEVYHLPSGSFKESGTGVDTRLVVINKV